MNIKNLNGDKAGVDLATGSRKYSVLAADGIQDLCITFIPEGRWGEVACVDAKRRDINVGEVWCYGECRG